MQEVHHRSWESFAQIDPPKVLPRNVDILLKEREGGGADDEQLAEIDAAREKLVQEAVEHLGQKVELALMFILGEVLPNAAKHGRGPITVAREFVPGNGAEIVVRDQGEGFDPLAVLDCEEEENLEKASGRGGVMVANFARRISASVELIRKEGGSAFCNGVRIRVPLQKTA